MVHKTKEHFCEKYDVSSFAALGALFDADLHEALMSEVGEEDDIVVKEFECGYKYHDRIIRHAKVVVSKSKQEV